MPEPDHAAKIKAWLDDHCKDADTFVRINVADGQVCCEFRVDRMEHSDWWPAGFSWYYGDTDTLSHVLFAAVKSVNATSDSLIINV